MPAVVRRVRAPGARSAAARALSRRLIDLPTWTYDDIRSRPPPAQRDPVGKVAAATSAPPSLPPGPARLPHRDVRGRPGGDGRIPVVGGNVSHRVELNRRGMPVRRHRGAGHWLTPEPSTTLNGV